MMGTGRVVIQPDTDEVTCRTWTWECGMCGDKSTGHRTSRVALADSEDHECQSDPLVVGQESLFGVTS